MRIKTEIVEERRTRNAKKSFFESLKAACKEVELGRAEVKCC
jgi:hypothetical protein